MGYTFLMEVKSTYYNLKYSSQPDVGRNFFTVDFSYSSDKKILKY